MNTAATPNRSSNVILFVAIAYAFTWLAWFPGVLATRETIAPFPWPPVFAIGTCGPLVAAVCCRCREGGWPAVRDWLRQGFARRLDWRWWLFILLVPLTVPPLALALNGLAGGQAGDPAILQTPWMALPIILLMVTIGGGQEEYGWRGYLLPELDARWRSWQADAFMVGVHVFWHLPLFFVAYTMQSRYPFWLFLAFGIGFTPLINRIYRFTGGSILAAVLFHGLVNAGLEIFPPVGPAAGNSILPLLLVGVLFGLLAASLAVPGQRILHKGREVYAAVSQNSEYKRSKGSGNV